MGDFSSLGIGVVTVVFGILLLLFIAFIVLVIVVKVRQAVQRGRMRSANAAAPEVQAQVRVIGKRVENLGRSLAGGQRALPSRNTVLVRMGDRTVYQRNLIGFEQAGGERFELEVPSDQYGLIAEGDTGTVSMKGTEFLGFAREVMR